MRAGSRARVLPATTGSVGADALRRRRTVTHDFAERLDRLGYRAPEQHDLRGRIRERSLMAREPRAHSVERAPIHPAGGIQMILVRPGAVSAS